MKIIVCATFHEQRVVESLLDHLQLPGYLCGTINYAIKNIGKPIDLMIFAFDIIPKLNRHAVDAEMLRIAITNENVNYWKAVLHPKGLYYYMALPVVIEKLVKESECVKRKNRRTSSRRKIKGTDQGVG